MKILQLQLLAFGPFTDRILDLSEGKEGFHVIYGPNEAGKSSSLRALRQLLFGIPARSEDDFIHPYRQMRIGGMLEHSDGSVVQLIRRKGRTHTLRGNDDTEVLDDAVLEKFLGTVESGVFESMFGIGYSDLVRGGQEILEGGGHVGQALFAAGSGIADLRRVQMALQAEAEALFTPSASKRKINEGLAALKQNQKALRQASLPGQDWEKHDQALQSAVQKKAQIERLMAEVMRDKNRLERIHDAFSLVARRKEVQAALEPYADAPLLPESFGEEYRGFLMELKMAENDRLQANQSLEETIESMKHQNVPPVVMEHAEQIEGLYQELGSYKKAAKDRVELLTRQEVLQSEASEVLSELRDDVSLDQAWRLKLKKKETVHIRELSGLWERLETRKESADEALLQAESALAALDNRLKSLEEPKSVEELGTLLDQARKYGSLEESCLQEMADVAALEQTLKERLSRQTLWSGTLESLFVLPMPSFETIDCFEKRLSEAEAEVHRCGTKIEDAQNQLLDIRGKIRHLHLTQDVPTEDDLQEARTRRNQGWLLVRNAWQTGVEERSAVTDFAEAVGSSGSLADAYEVSVAKADGVVDRLRREADRVAEKAGLLADERLFQERRKTLAAAHKEAVDALEEIGREWTSVWKDLGISPLSPREMRAWRQDMRAICDDANALRLRSERSQSLWEDIRMHHKALGLSLAQVDERKGDEVETLNDRIRRAQKVIKKQEALRSKKEDLQKEQKQRKTEILTAREKVAQCREALLKWQRDWEEALRPLSLDRNTKPAEANAVLDELASLFEKLNSAKILEKRIEGIDRDAEMFRSNLCIVARRVDPDLLQMGTEPLALELNAMLKRARSAKAARDGLEKEKQKYAAKRSRAEGRIAQLSARLNAMCGEAGCKTLDDLPLAEKRSDMRRKYSIEMERINEQLRKLAGGLTVDAFANEVLAEDPDSILPRIEAFLDEINELGGERSNLDQTIGSERRVLQEMDGSAAAAELAEARQQLLAGLETDIQTYARLRLSASLLARTIEQYREKHQGPVLKRTNAFFSRLTNGSFEGVRAEYDARGEAVLMGVRPGGAELVGISGMSDGTTDQLYLALRLASLEDYLEQNEPMPFIVDDILIKFDDDRSRMALKLLGELSRKTQVIFFTHHRHLVNLAESCLDPGVFIKHELES